MQELKRDSISLEIGDIIPLGDLKVIGFEGSSAKMLHVDSGFKSTLSNYSDLLNSRNYVVLRPPPEYHIQKEIDDLEAEREKLLAQKNSLFKKLQALKGQTNGD